MLEEKFEAWTWKQKSREEEEEKIFIERKAVLAMKSHWPTSINNLRFLLADNKQAAQDGHAISEDNRMGDDEQKGELRTNYCIPMTSDN